MHEPHARRVDERIELLLEILDQAFDRKGWHGTTLRGSLRGIRHEQALWRPAPRTVTTSGSSPSTPRTGSMPSGGDWSAMPWDRSRESPATGPWFQIRRWEGLEAGYPAARERASAATGYGAHAAAGQAGGALATGSLDQRRGDSRHCGPRSVSHRADPAASRS